jgi:hypothetical protein
VNLILIDDDGRELDLSLSLPLACERYSPRPGRTIRHVAGHDVARYELSPILGAAWLVLPDAMSLYQRQVAERAVGRAL